MTIEDAVRMYEKSTYSTPLIQRVLRDYHDISMMYVTVSLYGSRPYFEQKDTGTGNVQYLAAIP